MNAVINYCFHFTFGITEILGNAALNTYFRCKYLCYIIRILSVLNNE